MIATRKQTTLDVTEDDRSLQRGEQPSKRSQDNYHTRCIELSLQISINQRKTDLTNGTSGRGSLDLFFSSSRPVADSRLPGTMPVSNVKPGHASGLLQGVAGWEDNPDGASRELRTLDEGVSLEHSRHVLSNPGTLNAPQEYEFCPESFSLTKVPEAFLNSDGAAFNPTESKMRNMLRTGPELFPIPVRLNLSSSTKRVFFCPVLERFKQATQDGRNLKAPVLWCPLPQKGSWLLGSDEPLAHLDNSRLL